MFILTLTPSVRELGSRDLSNSFITFYSAVLYQAGEMSFNKRGKAGGLRQTLSEGNKVGRQDKIKHQRFRNVYLDKHYGCKKISVH